MKYKWGLGLELERMLFYLNNNKYYAVDINELFESRNSVDLLEEELDMLNKLPALETSGRKCMVSVKALMYEMVTTFPLNTKVEDKVNELRLDSERLLNIFTKIYNQVHDIKKKLIYSPVSAIKFRDIDGKFKFSNTGSLHINLTLPHTDDMSDELYLKMYQTYIHQFYWLEPLLYSVLTSGNYKSLTNNKYVKCCYRLTLGWGVAGGTDIDLLEKGQPRMISILPDYLKKIKFTDFVRETDTDCLKPMNFFDKYTKDIDLSVYFTDISTIARSNPLEIFKNIIPKNIYQKTGVREFKRGFGIEFRLFDECEPSSVNNILRFLIYLGENALNTIDIPKNLVYQNKIWNQAITESLQNGFKAKFSNEYIDLLQQNIKLNLPSYRKNSTYLLNKVSEGLFNKHRNGVFARNMFRYKYKTVPILENINKKFINHFSKKNNKISKNTKKKH